MVEGPLPLTRCKSAVVMLSNEAHDFPFSALHRLIGETAEVPSCDKITGSDHSDAAIVSVLPVPEAVATTIYNGSVPEGIVFVHPFDRESPEGVVIVPGFQGISKQGEVTTIGRGGSDATAVAFAKIFVLEVSTLCSCQ
mgnify:CR=1 FL=1